MIDIGPDTVDNFVNVYPTFSYSRSIQLYTWKLSYQFDRAKVIYWLKSIFTIEFQCVQRYQKYFNVNLVVRNNHMMVKVEKKFRFFSLHSNLTFILKFQTSIPQFKNPEMAVNRRFSDFLGLHEKLVETHQQKGRIVPPAPEKSVLGMSQ